MISSYEDIDEFKSLRKEYLFLFVLTISSCNVSCISLVNPLALASTSKLSTRLKKVRLLVYNNCNHILLGHLHNIIKLRVKITLISILLLEEGSDTLHISFKIPELDKYIQ